MLLALWSTSYFTNKRYTSWLVTNSITSFKVCQWLIIAHGYSIRTQTAKRVAVLPLCFLGINPCDILEKWTIGKRKLANKMKVQGEKIPKSVNIESEIQTEYKWSSKRNRWYSAILTLSLLERNLVKANLQTWIRNVVMKKGWRCARDSDISKNLSIKKPLRDNLRT